MKVCGQGMEVTLPIYGRERTFSETELIAILEEHFNKAKPPTENQWFWIDPLAIDQKLFQTERADPKQEKTRKWILKAFAEVKKDPKKYGRKFKTMRPEQRQNINIKDVKAWACEMGDHIADWVEQALEWAQRIANEETWKELCNDNDTSKYFRLVVWENGYVRYIGGSRVYKYAASDVGNNNISDGEFAYGAVPLVVDYEE